MNLRNNHKIQSLLLALLGLFTLTQCYAPRDEFEEGVPVKVHFAIAVPESPVREMRATSRSTASSDDENRLYNVALFIFDRANLDGKPTGYFFDNLDAVSQKEFDVETSTGRKKIVAITNLATDTHSTITGLKKSDFFDGEVSKVQSITDLQNKVAAYNDGEATVFAEGDAISFLMSSDPNVDYTIREDNQTVDVEVQRLAAKVEFMLQPADNGATFIPLGWRVVNVPKKSYLIERAITASGDAYDASSATNQSDYFNSYASEEEWHEREGSGYGTEFPFYTFENRKNPQKLIDAATTPNEIDRYRLRAKRKKTATGETAQYKPELNNGSFEYAPEYCTYVQIKGTYEGSSATSLDGDGDPKDNIYADVVYSIPLGYYEKDANDYKVERNTYYQYKVKVTGVKDVVVEARRTAPTYTDSERHPGAEASVMQGAPRWNWVIDSHYEQRLLEFENDERYRTFDFRSCYFVVTTPFGNMSFTGKQLEDDPILRDKALKLTDWIRIRRNNMSKRGGGYYYYGETQSQLCRYPSQKADGSPLYSYPSGVKEEYLLKNIYEWCRVLQHDLYKVNAESNPSAPWSAAYYARENYQGDDYTIMGYSNSSPAVKNHCYATVYFDEYYYETHPLTGAPVKWNTFVGKGPRTLAVYKKYELSRDGKSIYLSEPLVRVVQRPIYTIYSPMSVDVSAADNAGLPSDWSDMRKTSLLGYGVESVNEMGFLNYPKFQPTGEFDAALPHVSFYGWFNWTHITKFRDPTSTDAGWQYPAWKEFYKTSVYLSEQDIINEPEDSHKYTVYGCLYRNRDLNRNGKIEASEIRWYLPSIGQLIELGLGEDALPEDVRLYNNVVKGGSRQNYSFVSSSIKANPQGGYYKYVLPYLWSSQAFATNSDPSNGIGWSDAAFQGYSHRCVRRLGSAVDGVLGMHLASQPFLTRSGELSVEMTKINTHLLRSAKYYVAHGEQPTHPIHDDKDKPYREFYVARNWIPYTGANTCANYADGRFNKTGDWRIPNFREMGYIISAFDLGEGEDSFKMVWGDGTTVKLTNGTVFYTNTYSGDAPSNHMHLIYQTGYNWHIQAGTVGLEGKTKYVRCVKDKS